LQVKQVKPAEGFDFLTLFFFSFFFFLVWWRERKKERKEEKVRYISSDFYLFLKEVDCVCVESKKEKKNLLPDIRS
jgi:hypothetical protein